MTTFTHISLTSLLRVSVGVLILTIAGACARAPDSHPVDVPFDPYEKQNRATHEFNLDLDRKLVRPVGTGYSNFLPDDIETGIGRFARNFALPSDVVNNVLQGNMRGAFGDTARFLVNSTVGLAGFFDPATEMNVPPPTETDFGETLHVWGARQGAYVELPVLGPSTERDTWGLVVDVFTNPLSYILDSPENYYGTLTSVSASLSNRGKFADQIDSILYESEDSYIQARSLYLQNRQFELGNGGSDTYVDPYDEVFGLTTGENSDE